MFAYLKKAVAEVFIPPTSSNHYAPLDGMRAISILLVLAFHTTFLGIALHGDTAQGIDYFSHATGFAKLAFQGDIGVDIFFVLSGFLICNQLLRELSTSESINITWFYTKRLLRIYPLYIFLLTPYVIFQGPAAEHAWKNYLFLNNYTQSPMLRWCWSIAVEVHFYLLAPFLILLLKKVSRPYLVMLLISALLLLARYLSFESIPGFDTQTIADYIASNNRKQIDLFNNFVYEPSHMRLVTFMPGILAAWVYFHHKQTMHAYLNNKSWTVYALAAITLLFIVLASYNRHPLSTHFTSLDFFIHDLAFVFGRAILASLAAIIMLFTLSNAAGTHWLKNFLSHPFFYSISRTSYCVYLFNFGTIGLAYLAVNKLSKNAFAVETGVNNFNLSLLALTFVLTVIISVIFGALCYALIERWFLTGKIKDWAKKRLG